MGDRTRGWLLRAAPRMAFMLAAGSWIPLALFVVQVTTLQWRWWQAPWGSSGQRLLLGLTTGLALAYALGFGLMLVFINWLIARGRNKQRLAGYRWIDAGSVVMYALIAAWSWAALFHGPSEHLLWSVAAAWTALTIISSIQGFQQVARRTRRATGTP